MSHKRSCRPPCMPDNYVCRALLCRRKSRKREPSAHHSWPRETMSDPPDAPCPPPSGLAALRRLVEIAITDTGQSRAVADFLLAWWNARACGGLDLTTLWIVAPPIRDDMLTVLDLIAHHRELPTAYGLGDTFTALVARWRPGIVQAHR